MTEATPILPFILRERCNPAVITYKMNSYEKQAYGRQIPKLENYLRKLIITAERTGHSEGRAQHILGKHS